MRLPSIQKISHDALETILRFPLPLLSAFTATVAALILMDHQGPPQPTLLWGLLLGGILGIPLLFAATLGVERHVTNSVSGWSVKIGALLLVVAYACVVPQDLTNAPAVHIIRLLLLAFAAHMLVAVIPFATSNEANGFWQFNKALFLRILIAALFTLVIFAGLAFALAALDNLFDMQIPGRRYGELWVLVTGMFTSWFFLAGVPDKINELEGSADYPKGIKIFAQYILIPIVLVYLVILYAYMAKILISWDWPQGWVSKLILGFAGAGVLSLLLLDPLGRKPEQAWIRALGRWFYAGLIPMTVILFLAVWRRVGEYGITEGRYLALGLGVWLVAAIVYFLLLSGKSLKFIPASLCVGALIMSFGPWGMSSIAERSQTSRLELLLKKNSILVDGKAKKTTGNLPAKDTHEISAILSYLHEMHGYESIQPWFDVVLREDTSSAGVRYTNPSAVAALMGVDFMLVRQEYGNVVVLAAAKDSAYDIRGFEGLVRERHFYAGMTEKQFQIGEIWFSANDSLDTLTVIVLQGEARGDSVRLDIGQMLAAVLKANDNRGADHISPSVMTLATASGVLNARVFITEARLRRDGAQMRIMSYTVNILYAVGGQK
jgi:hypothetical protein